MCWFVYTNSSRGGGNSLAKSRVFSFCQNIKCCYSGEIEQHYKIKKAFTLAEVLITLGIIGVVVSMTLSVLISEYKKEVTVNKLRHVYSLLKNAESMAVKDYGDMSGWDFIAQSPSGQHPSLNTSVITKYYFPYLKTHKCKYTASIKSSTGVQFAYVSTTGGMNYVCLPDGTMLYGNTLSNGYKGTIVFADLNGEKGPNVVGRDVFTFLINRPVYKSDDYNTSSYRVIPKCPVGISTCFAGPYHGAEGYYWEGDEETLIQYCISGTDSGYTISEQGNSCAYMVEQAGWKVPKNYPLRI